MSRISRGVPSRAPSATTASAPPPPPTRASSRTARRTAAPQRNAASRRSRRATRPPALRGPPFTSGVGFRARRRAIAVGAPGARRVEYKKRRRRRGARREESSRGGDTLESSGHERARAPNEGTGKSGESEREAPSGCGGGQIQASTNHDDRVVGFGARRFRARARRRLRNGRRGRRQRPRRRASVPHHRSGGVGNDAAAQVRHVAVPRAGRRTGRRGRTTRARRGNPRTGTRERRLRRSRLWSLRGVHVGVLHGRGVCGGVRGGPRRGRARAFAWRSRRRRRSSGAVPGRAPRTRTRAAPGDGAEEAPGPHPRFVARGRETRVRGARAPRVPRRSRREFRASVSVFARGGRGRRRASARERPGRARDLRPGPRRRHAARGGRRGGDGEAPVRARGLRAGRPRAREAQGRDAAAALALEAVAAGKRP